MAYGIQVFFLPPSDLMRLPNQIGPWYFLLPVSAGHCWYEARSLRPICLDGSVAPAWLCRSVPSRLRYEHLVRRCTRQDRCRSSSTTRRESGQKRCPVIIFSHGLGGSRDGYAYLGHRWASYGILSVAPSTSRKRRGRLAREDSPAARTEVLLRRSCRISRHASPICSSSSTRLEKHVAENSPLGQMIDAERIGVGGHAFGALAALALAGQHASVLEMAETGPDRRIKAVLALSSPILFDGLDYEQAYEDIRIPVLHMTGTNDDSPVGPTRAPHRRIPFDNIHDADQFLITFSGADHLTFSGHLRDRAAKDDPYFQSRIAAASTAFWLGYLGGLTPATDQSSLRAASTRSSAASVASSTRARARSAQFLAAAAARSSSRF